jgi:hypothetical protein
MDPNYFTKQHPNSFSRFDESRVVTTPRSIIACDLEGVSPDELIPRGVTSPNRKRFAAGTIDFQKQKFEEEFEERERRKLVDVVKKRWSMLSHPSSRMGSAKAHPPPKKNNPSPRQNGGEGGISVSSKKWVAGLEKSIAMDAACVIDEDVTVAQQFLRLKTSVEASRQAKAALEEKELAARERYESLMSSRRQQAEEQARKFETRHVKVLTLRQEHLEERREKHERRLEALQQRLDTADKLVAEIKLTKSSKAATRDGEEERLAAERAKREKTEALELKLEAANHAAQERRHVKELSDEMKQFHMNLKRQAMERAQDRAKKVQAYRQQQIREREDEDAAFDSEKAAQRTQEDKARHAAREILAHQREALRSYVEACVAEGIEEVRPPDWLASRVQLLERQSNGKAPQVPQRPQQNQQQSALRSKRFTSSQREVISPQRGKFSVQSPRISERQSFGKWMFE